MAYPDLDESFPNEIYPCGATIIEIMGMRPTGVEV